MKTKFKPTMITEDMKRAAKTVFMCMAMVETIRPIVEGYQNKILNEEKYEYSEKTSMRREKTPMDWIKTPEHTYLMSDDDFKHYLKRCREEQAKAKLKTDSPDHCPLLVVEHQLVKAHRLLCDVMEPLTKMSADDLLCSKDGMKNYKHYIDLTLRLLASLVKDTI